MTTIVAVRYAGLAALSADSGISIGDVELPSVIGPRKIIRSGDALIGLCGDLAHVCAVGAALKRAPLARFRSGAELHTAWTRLHERLKQSHHLQPENTGEAYESTHVTALVASPVGIFSVYPMREVIEHGDYWAIGSGAAFALGAVSGVLAQSEAHELYFTAGYGAECGVTAASRFDRATRPPVITDVVVLEERKRSEGRRR